MSSVVAAAGVFLLAAFAPFEMTTPIVRLPGQSLTNLEAVLLVVLAAWGIALLASRRFPSLPPVAWAWLALIVAMAIASALAPSDRMNAWHMTGRFAAAAAVFVLTVDGMTSGTRLHAAMLVSLVAGVAVAVAVLLEYAQVDWALRALLRFRPATSVVGAQLRAGGTLQYPTIASMYLEVVFAFGLGLMLWASDASRRIHTGAVLLALIAVGEAIALTFTRAGLITMATSLVLTGAFRVYQRGIDEGFCLLLVLATAVVLLLGLSRSTQSLWLRMTTEGQTAWYRADVAAPRTLSIGADRFEYVTVSVTNTGRTSWDSNDDPPIYISYHWLQPERERVVAFEGERTAFDHRIGPGETAVVHALVRAPSRPGEYRLQWDLVQEGSLWFSTEQDAPDPSVSRATVSGAAVGALSPMRDLPRRAVRPGRFALWRAALRMVKAHPLLGVGPDNFRLMYGTYAGLTGADERTHSNNMYLEVLVGGGVLAAAAFGWLFRESSRLVIAICRRRAPCCLGVAAAVLAIALHGTVDSFLSFGPTYVLFALTIGFAAAAAGGMETPADAHRV
jgi:hypothetical protein